MTPHIESKIEDIAQTVLLPGDPLRAKYIADNYLENTRQVNNIRGMLAYTGTYKNKNVTVFATGMGMPSAGIYVYELFKYYNVENIIRIGSCGSNTPDLKLLDVVLSSSSYTEGNFALSFNNNDVHEANASTVLNNTIIETAEKINQKISVRKTICSEVFDPYMTDYSEFMKRMPKDGDVSEMESFAIFYLANFFNKNASCLLTVSDSKFDTNIVSTEERQTSLNNMILLALESTLSC
ncbi:MAG: purine-nucleoside phosphorylase [bacterium]